MLVFSNNAETVLTEPLSMNDTPWLDHGVPFAEAYMDEELWPMVIEPTDRDLFSQEISYPPMFLDWDRRDVGGYPCQLVTITNEAEFPGEYEVVAIFSFNYDGVAFVQRNYEGSEAYISDWPAGSKVSARVTARTLESFVQPPPDRFAEVLADGEGRNYLKRIGSGGTNIGGPSASESYATISNIHGWGVLEENYFGVDSMGYGSPADSMMSRETVVRTQSLWFSGAPSFDPSSWVEDKQILVPAVPNGHQYLFNYVAPGGGHQFDPMDPPDFDEFDTDRPSEIHDDPDADEPWLIGYFIPAPYPVTDMRLDIHHHRGNYAGGSILLSEIVFVCEFCDSVTQPPVLRIEEVDFGDPTGRVLVDDVELDQLVLGGGASVHRIPVTAGGALIKGTSITVTTPGGGQLLGFIYFKGVAFDVRPWY